jgi:hypothetical protein
MCCVYRDCIHLFTVIKWYWWVAVPGAVGHCQRPTEERGSWNLMCALHAHQYSLWQGVCYRHADCYSVWKFKMKGKLCIYHSSSTLHDTHSAACLPLFVTEFHSCSFFTVCDNTRGTTICAKCISCDLKGDMVRTCFMFPAFLFHSYCTICWIFIFGCPN